MRLKAFRVQNYKKIRDTGWVSCRDLTAFVGKNEAGKSAIFRGLSKLNPSDGERYDGLKEFPRRRYSDEFATQDWPVASGRFCLNEDEQEALVALCPLLKDVKTVLVTRRYSGNLSVGFEPVPDSSSVTAQLLRESIDQAIEQVQGLTAPRGKGPELGTTKQAALAGLQQAREGIPTSDALTRAHITPAISAVMTQANEEWQKTLLSPTVASLRSLAERAAASEQLQAARNWVAEHLPRFIYFDNYDVIDSAIHVPTFVSQLASTPNAPRVRTTNCLFQHVGLDVQRLAQLGRHEVDESESEDIRREVDERAILASSASNAMTQKFADWWEQRRHKFRYQFDGDYFRIWVSDDLDPSEIELDQRSAGMQYFFSFFTVFLVEAAGAHSGSILLLDEPGMHLHGTAQAAIVQFLDHLSPDNQTFYTTHSPFMVDVDHLERARAVYEHEDGTTQVSEDVWPRDRDSLFPLQAALGYQLAQGLFIAKRQIIVEGLTDLWLLKALDQVLAMRGREHLRTDVILVPSAGVAKLIPLASMLIGHDVEVAALLDGDEPARKEGKKLVKKLLANEDRKCLFIGDFTSRYGAELEDVFPESEYLDAVRTAYPNIRLTLNADEKALSGVVDKVEAFFTRKNLGRFEKWRAAAVLRDRIVDSPDAVIEETLDIIEQIYTTVNGLFLDD